MSRSPGPYAAQPKGQATEAEEQLNNDQPPRREVCQPTPDGAGDRGQREQE
jgi:hypothetical protein